MKPLLQFSHANGFPAPCYRAFLAALAKRFDVRYVPQFGHDPKYPVTDGWPHLVSELIAAVEQHGRPAIAVGHSLGGYLSFLAAARRPDLFRAVILLDAPIMSRFQGSALAFAKRVGFIDRVTLAGTTKGRRSTWPSADSALAHFSSKPAFRTFDPRCLTDYVRYGTEPGGHGVVLRFDTEVEYNIYRTIPHDIQRAGRRLGVPGGIIVGTESDLVARLGLRTSGRYLRIASVDGGHLFPFEHPEPAAAAVIAMAKDLVPL
ncbi:MAG: alpha/beta hydrolase [Burkholderiales bacterium]|nr:alpha/beta hydrolase [Burkholderiales bacterium]